jgi:predicted small secreted protein
MRLPDKETMFDYALFGTMAVVLGIWLGGCNTIKGLSKDVYSATDALQASFSDTNPPEHSVRPNDWD